METHDQKVCLFAAQKIYDQLDFVAFHTMVAEFDPAFLRQLESFLLKDLVSSGLVFLKCMGQG